MMMRGAFESQPGFGGEATQVVSNCFFVVEKMHRLEKTQSSHNKGRIRWAL